MLDKGQQLILQLIKSCEYYHLNEKQSIGCINKILNRNISRRSYYIYKRRLYSHDVFNRLKESIYNSSLERLSILLLNDDADLEVKTKVNKLVAGQFPGKVLSHLQSPYDENNDNNGNMRDKVKNVLAKIKQFKETEKLSKDMINSLPNNTTIREEFIKCGKDACNLCPHGPYYYGYWKEKIKDDNKSKLRKRYLGNIDPRH